MKATAHVTFMQSHYADPSGKKPINVELNSYDPTNYMSPGQIYAGQFEVEIPFAEPKSSDFVLAEVAALRRKQGELVAEGTRLEERIQSLLCIEAPKAEVL